MLAREKSNHSILESKSIMDVTKHVQPDSFVIFDLDNTVMESCQELGSDQWFTKLMKISFAAAPYKSTEYNVIELYHAVHAQTEMQMVEPSVVDVIKKLQENHVPILGLTARGAPIAERTVYQLKSIGISFAIDKNQEKSFLLKTSNEDRGVLFHHGIVFCQGKSKGDALLDYFKHFNNLQPKHILMIDDKDKHLKCVSQAVLSFASFTGLHYRFLDKKIEFINMEKAHQQLANIKEKLSKEGVTAATQLGLIKSSESSTLATLSFFNKQITNDKKDEPIARPCPWL